MTEEVKLETKPAERKKPGPKPKPKAEPIQEQKDAEQVSDVEVKQDAAELVVSEEAKIEPDCGERVEIDSKNCSDKDTTEETIENTRLPENMILEAKYKQSFTLTCNNKPGPHGKRIKVVRNLGNNKYIVQLIRANGAVFGTMSLEDILHASK